ncbi:dolichyl-phosphate-mannose-protein mannosyltransferase [Pseudonocardia sediminis]|uniref:Dolichyl-phosphate-mannose-protein mannosyltransferase n=1 Tax=Pseudonocardia sediminis TaxID=1397368 RepID=A0A4Q7V2I6_PSEST|nr:glycosyltransferase family 39 protein [Pseudonocardia sediminis]RZT87694.1 dolichyl-phosphate-mannose-protein mannosyltransferase [Pseudonocardia sediminis]
MTTVLDRSRVTPASAPPRRPTRTGAVFAAALLGYLLIGTVLVFGFDSIMEDALARVSAASSVTSASDPKLAAVGFVWTPLPALLMVPFAPLRALFPGLVSTGYLAVLLSAVSMAGAVAALHGIVSDLRVRAGARVLVVGLFALSPLVLIYGTNGMTEALLMLFLLLAVRALLRWVRDGGRTNDLVAAGLFLGLGYLARYEAIVPAAAVTVLVAVVTAVRTRDRHAVLVDVLLAGLPAAAAFVVWAVLSAVIVGSPFEQFTSAYGNAALVSAAGSGGLADVARQLAALAPLGLPVLLAAGWVTWRRRDVSAPVPVTVLGSVLALEWLLRASGNLFGFLRYQIMVLPLLAVLVAVLLAGAPRRRGWRSVGAAALAVLVLGGSTVTSAVLVTNAPVLASQEYLRVRPVVDTALGRAVTDTGANGMWADDRAIAARLDAMDLPEGGVLADSGAAFAVVAASAHPERFLITSDDGFAAALADPAAHGIRYVLRNDRGGVDAVRSTHPDPAATGWAREVARWPGSTRWSYGWSLWQVT